MKKTYKDRPMTIKGNIVHLHAWELRPQEETYDYSQKVGALESVVNDMASSSKIVPIYIQGQTGSGKTVLANVLKENGNNVEIVDVLSLKESGNNTPSKLISDSSITYIVDEAGYADMEIISKVEEHSKKGGIVIMLLQDIRDLPKKVMEVEVKPKYLKLSRGKLIEISI